MSSQYNCNHETRPTSLSCALTYHLSTPRSHREWSPTSTRPRQRALRAQATQVGTLPEVWGRIKSSPRSWSSGRPRPSTCAYICVGVLVARSPVSLIAIEVGGVVCSAPVLWYAYAIAIASSVSTFPLLSSSSNLPLLSSSSLILLLLSSFPSLLFGQQVLYGQRGGRDTRESGLPHLPVL